MGVASNGRVFVADDDVVVVCVPFVVAVVAAPAADVVLSAVPFVVAAVVLQAEVLA